MKSTIHTWDLKNKVVIVRIDANVPINQGTILDDQRLLASLPTINLLLDQGAQVLLVSHLGRPQDKEKHLSNKHLISWFKDVGYDIVFADSVASAQQQLASGHKLVLLENIRFFPGEKKHDTAFAQKLATLGQYYVNDAFGTLHRTDTSITLVPKQFDPLHKSIGLLVEHELAMLDSFFQHPQQPFMLIIGGGKIEAKAPLIAELLPKLSALFLGPGLVFTFLKAEGKKIGRSLLNEQMIDLCKEIITQAEQLNIPIYYPHDYIVSEGSYDGPLQLIETDQIPEYDVGISIGPKTVQAWTKELLTAKTILVNGLMGTVKRAESLVYLQELYRTIAHAHATTIIAGGDSAAAAYSFGMARNMSYISTGGGATLHYLSGDKLPGLAALKNGTKT